MAALEDQGAATDGASDPLLVAGARDNMPQAAANGRDGMLQAAADDSGYVPLAPAYEPDGMAQLKSVDASADADSSFAPGVESVDALTDMGQDASLADAAAGIVACAAWH